jgi:ABC-type lipoprotein release transport system permease subunit
VVYQVSPRDPLVFVVVPALVVVLGVASCWAPARRAMEVAPITALRPD